LAVLILIAFPLDCKAFLACFWVLRIVLFGVLASMLLVYSNKQKANHNKSLLPQSLQLQTKKTTGNKEKEINNKTRKPKSLLVVLESTVSCFVWLNQKRFLPFLYFSNKPKKHTLEIKSQTTRKSQTNQKSEKKPASPKKKGVCVRVCVCVCMCVFAVNL
jgi:hypothetical protein